MELKLIGEMDNSDGTFEQQNRVYGVEGLAPTITTQAGGSLQPKFLECRQVGFMDNGTGKHQSNTVWSDEGLSPTITTIDNGGTQQIKVMSEYANIYGLLLDIFGLCGTINEKEEEKYERSKPLLRLLWQEIGKKEIWQEVRRQWSIPKTEILRPQMYENGLFEDWESQSIIPIGPCDSGEHNEEPGNRTKMLNMWESWKTRYTPHRWELSEQQYRELNVLMQELSHETAQDKTDVQDLWCANERFGVLRQTLSKIQEIWRPAIYEKQVTLRIRKLTPRETWRLMAFDDEDYEKAAEVNSQTQLYKQAGNSIVVSVLEAIFGEML